jgi:hypothetical protein
MELPCHFELEREDQMSSIQSAETLTPKVIEQGHNRISDGEAEGVPYENDSD